MKVTSDEENQHSKREDKTQARYSDDVAVHIQKLVSAERKPALLLYNEFSTVLWRP